MQCIGTDSDGEREISVQALTSSRLMEYCCRRWSSSLFNGNAHSFFVRSAKTFIHRQQLLN